jgi:hypothetical protein
VSFVAVIHHSFFIFHLLFIYLLSDIISLFTNLLRPLEAIVLRKMLVRVGGGYSICGCEEPLIIVGPITAIALLLQVCPFLSHSFHL